MQNILVHSGEKLSIRFAKMERQHVVWLLPHYSYSQALAIKALLEKGFRSLHVSDIWLGQSSGCPCISARGHSFHATWHQSPLTLWQSGLHKQVQLTPCKIGWIKSNH